MSSELLPWQKAFYGASGVSGFAVSLMDCLTFFGDTNEFDMFLFECVFDFLLWFCKLIIRDVDFLSGICSN